MRKTTYFILIVLILASVAALFGYRAMEEMKMDNRAPEIILEDRIPEVSVLDPREMLLQGVTAVDKKDGDVTDLMVVERVRLLNSSGDIEVNYAAFDRSGNVAKAQRNARYTDYSTPKFTLSRSLALPYGYNFDLLGIVGATDLVDGDIQHRVRATALDGQTITDVGVHEVRFQVSNSLGDTVSYVMPVEVYDAKLYDAELTLSEYIVYLSAGEAFEPKTYLDTFVFRGSSVNLQGSLPRYYSLKTTGQVQTDVPGVYPVEFRVTYTVKNEKDQALDQHYTGYSKLIVIVEG